jgi:hypothetical protein
MSGGRACACGATRSDPPPHRFRQLQARHVRTMLASGSTSSPRSTALVGLSGLRADPSDFRAREGVRWALMHAQPFQMARQIDRVPSMVVPLDGEQTLRLERLLDTLTLVDMHEHPMVLTDDIGDLPAYFRSHAY